MPAGVQFLALIRGINVGGKNLVKMDELRATFEAMGFADVATYIQSGNVLFRAPRQRRQELALKIEAELSRHVSSEPRIVILTHAELSAAVKDAPRGFGADTHKCDVIFVRRPLTPKRAIAVVETKEGIDSAWAGTKVVYFSRLAARASGSRLSKVAALPEYQSMTIRSWSTTTKLLALMDSRGGIG